MAHEHSIRRYRHWYTKLLRLYPKAYYERFGESMEQTFTDLLRERAADGRRLFGCALWMFVETFAALLRENMMHRKIIRIALVTACILLLPVLAMQFTDEVAWDLVDFAVAGVLLFGAGLTYEVIARKGGTPAYRVAVGVAVATALVLIWMNLAVGLIGNEGNPANLMYVAVLAVGLFGAIIARFQPHGLARALFATAAAQMLVAVVALIAGFGFTLILNGFFAVLWVGSAALFQHAARSEPV
jgi:hypothetical protein